VKTSNSMKVDIVHKDRYGKIKGTERKTVYFDKDFNKIEGDK